MKPLIVHNIAGEARRLSPLQVVGWVRAEHKVDNGRFMVGAVIALAAGAPVAVAESEEQLDWMFEQATGFRITAADLDALREALAEGAADDHS